MGLGKKTTTKIFPKTIFVYVFKFLSPTTFTEKTFRSIQFFWEGEGRREGGNFFFFENQIETYLKDCFDLEFAVTPRKERWPEATRWNYTFFSNSELGNLSDFQLYSEYITSTLRYSLTSNFPHNSHFMISQALPD